MATNNSAYDYSLYNKNSANEQYSNQNNNAQSMETSGVQQVPNITMKIIPQKKGSAVLVFLIALLALTLFTLVINGMGKTYQMYRQVAEQNTLLETTQAENARLKSELEGKMALKNIEEYAEKTLGLQKLDNSQIKYIQTQTDDVIEIPDEEKGFLIKIKEKFESFAEYIFG